MFLEVESSENCESSLFLRFKEGGPSRPVIQIKNYDRSSTGEWCEVVGYTDDAARPWCTALAQPVEDSGAGLAILIFGGVGGIRLKPVSCEEEWDLKSPRQWGETHLLLADSRDLRYGESETL